MRIAQVSPLYESVPPKMYGGTERVVSYLTEALIKKGHEVTLFASGDSRTTATLISNIDEALRLKNIEDPLAHHIVQMQEVIERASEFDIIHFHTDYLHFPFTYNANIAHLTTLHGRLDIPDLAYIYNKFKAQPLVSISHAQRKPLPQVNWAGTAYHGLPLNLYSQGNGDGDYLVFIGRISPEKRPDRAIEIAQKAGMKLKIAAKIDKVDEHYYNSKIKKLMRQPHVEYLGEIGETDKGELLANARALLFPIDWPEPFGMVMIESIACGTPVIAYPHGSVSEIIDEGLTGYLVNSIDAAVEAVERSKAMDRQQIRQQFEKRFSDEVMAQTYLDIYDKLLMEKRKALYSNNGNQDSDDKSQKRTPQLVA